MRPLTIRHRSELSRAVIYRLLALHPNTTARGADIAGRDCARYVGSDAIAAH
jgi:hypothetical protein